ncbi:MAG: hypothetical protein RI907_3377 [Pseudomonadota bacterium]|jgi:hypothetical protein
MSSGNLHSLRIASSAGGLAMSLIGTSWGQQAYTPKLPPVVVTSADGCGVLALNPDDPLAANEHYGKAIDSMRLSVWSGGCKNGLRHGVGSVTYPPGSLLMNALSIWYFNGRPGQGTPHAFRLKDGKVIDTRGGTHFHVNNLDEQGMPKLQAPYSTPKVVLIPDPKGRKVMYQFLVPSTIHKFVSGPDQEAIGEDTPYASSAEALSAWREIVVPMLKATMALDKDEQSRMAADMAEALALQSAASAPKPSAATAAP